MSERGRYVIRNPAEAVAAAKCWLATWSKAGGGANLPPVDSYHPDKCVYCEQPRDFLIRVLEEFRDWSFISSYVDDETPLRLEVEQFLALPTHEQDRLVKKAQSTEARLVNEQPEEDPWWNKD